MCSARACSAGDGVGDGEELGDDEDDIPPPLFVDGLVDSVSYQRIRDLFALFGKLRNVFVQRSRKQGRKHRFGFVRFLSRINATSAVEALNGIKVGGSVLYVAWDRFHFTGAAKLRGKIRGHAKDSEGAVNFGEGGANHALGSDSGRHKVQMQKGP